MSDFVVTGPQRQVVYSSELSQWLKDAADEVEERDDCMCWFVRKGAAAAAAAAASWMPEWESARCKDRPPRRESLSLTDTTCEAPLASFYSVAKGQKSKTFSLFSTAGQTKWSSEPSKFLNFKPIDFTANQFHPPLQQPGFSSDCGQHWMQLKGLFLRIYKLFGRF